MDCERNGRDESVTCAWCRMGAAARAVREWHAARVAWFAVGACVGAAVVAAAWSLS
jgi:hypothetical protein